MVEHGDKEVHNDHGHDLKKKDNYSLTGFIHSFLQNIFNTLSSTLRRFVAFSLAMFFLGTLFGSLIPHITSHMAIEPIWLIGAPLILAVLSYYFTEVAALIFILLLGVFLLFFL